MRRFLELLVTMLVQGASPGVKEGDLVSQYLVKCDQGRHRRLASGLHIHTHLCTHIYEHTQTILTENIILPIYLLFDFYSLLFLVIF